MQKTEVDDDTRWLTDPPETVAAIYDVDVGAVDREEPWVKVSRRICPREGAYTGPAMLSLKGAMQWHPVMRSSVKGVDRIHCTCIEALPHWLQGRIAVLNMAEADVQIPGVGKRWSTNEEARAGTWTYSTGANRFYTIERNCEGLPR